MKTNSLSRVAAAVLVGLLLTVSASAQTSLSQTTVSTAITDVNTRVLVVASATGATANTTGAFVDGEFMPITAVSGTSLTVVRGGGATRARLHAAGALVYIGPNVAFTTVDPGGACTSTSQQYLPLINISDGVIWNCVGGAVGTQSWQGYQVSPSQAYTVPRTIITAQSYTILPTDYLVILSTTSSGVSTRTFTLPSHTGLTGKVITIKDESGGISATTSIVLVGTIDGTNSSVATVIQLKTAFGWWSGYAGSGGWFSIGCGNGGGAVVSACR